MGCPRYRSYFTTGCRFGGGGGEGEVSAVFSLIFCMVYEILRVEMEDNLTTVGGRSNNGAKTLGTCMLRHYSIANRQITQQQLTGSPTTAS